MKPDLHFIALLKWTEWLERVSCWIPLNERNEYIVIGEWHGVGDRKL